MRTLFVFMSSLSVILFTRISFAKSNSALSSLVNIQVENDKEIALIKVDENEDLEITFRGIPLLEISGDESLINCICTEYRYKTLVLKINKEKLSRVSKNFTLKIDNNIIDRISCSVFGEFINYAKIQR
ncbi:MAG: hypothetical protein N3A61_07530 [Ignavibacteria bacterium]|nr:hypothetical protein [Ignavibacteria bacterium]